MMLVLAVRTDPERVYQRALNYFTFAPGASSLLAIGVRSALAFMPRATLVDHVRNTEGLALCGRGAACPG